MALVTIGTRFSEHIPAEQDGTEGYDGQFNYFIARDPSTASQFLDVPAYRFQRILFPMLGRVLALGQPDLIPWAFLLINLVSLAVGTALLEKLLVSFGVSRWYAFTYGLTLGIFGSVRLSLSEPLAYGLVIGGILLAREKRWLWAAVVLALAALAKETTLIFVGAYGLYLLTQRDIKNALLLGMIAVVPFAMWQLILRSTLGEMGIGSGGAMATSFEIIPFAGVARIWTDTPAEARGTILLILGPMLLIFVLIPTIWALWAGIKAVQRGKWSAETSLLLVNAAVMLFVPFSTYREPIGILRFIVGLQIAVILFAAQNKRFRVLRNSTLWIVTVFFVLTLVTS
ncbi:MAG: hypothetical protein LCI00_00940 [Chloroflexi bacterium]|nr:hypothetical protein [Chloroflexota bacterium]MCC6896997.1 hypothetical protein [Anaerolineae bacterium]